MDDLIDQMDDEVDEKIERMILSYYKDDDIESLKLMIENYDSGDLALEIALRNNNEFYVRWLVENYPCDTTLIRLV